MHDVAVIGAGPAGIAASIYLKRAGIDLILFEKDEIGGLLLNAHLVENYPGFPDGIRGKKLGDFFQNHLDKWKIKTIISEIKQIKVEKNQFILQNVQNDKMEFKAVIIATGTKPKTLNIPEETELSGKLVFYEIKNLLKIVQPGDIVNIVGGGDAAFDYSLNLADNGVFVELYYRTEKPKCLVLLEKRVTKYPNIKLHPLYEPVEIRYDNKKLETIFISIDDNQEIIVKSDYILIACGRIPSNELFTDIEKNNIPGLNIAGDCQTGRFRQTGIAVGQGIRAAMELEAYIRGKNND